MDWPEGIEQIDDEAEKFNSWLQENHLHLSLVRRFCNDDFIAKFFVSNRKKIESCRCLKVFKKSRRGGRKDRRIGLVAQVILAVYDCQEDLEMIGSSLSGTILNISESGIGLEVDTFVHPQSILTVTVVPPIMPLTIYELSAEVRWCNSKGNHYHTGLEFFEIGDVGKWREDFHTKFLAQKVLLF